MAKGRDERRRRAKKKQTSVRKAERPNLDGGDAPVRVPLKPN
jgi:hypothetical protein